MTTGDGPRPHTSLDPPRSQPPASFFFFAGSAPPEIYTLSLHDALPIFQVGARPATHGLLSGCGVHRAVTGFQRMERSEEHTSELQSRGHLVCRLLLEKKNKRNRRSHDPQVKYVRSAGGARKTSTAGHHR